MRQQQRISYVKSVVLGFFLAHTTLAQAGIKVLFTPGTAVKEAILTELNGTDRTLDVAMYSFSETEIVNAVLAAGQRGVQVRLILHDAPAQEEKVRKLEAAGIDVRFVVPIMHHKFAIIDGSESGSSPALLTGSGNWSTSMNGSFDEDFLQVHGESDLFAAFQAEFNYLWQNSRPIGSSFFPGAVSVSVDTARVVFTSLNMEAYNSNDGPSFRPIVQGDDGAAGVAIKEAISSAKSSIDIASTHFRRPDIFASLVAAMNRGVTVRMLLDGQEFEPNSVDDGSNRHFDEKLTSLGASVRYKSYSRYWSYPTAKQMHTKYMVIDQRTVVTGSFNWSYNAELKTLENLLVLADEDVVQTYSMHFASLFESDEQEFSRLLQDIRDHGGTGPCHFAPQALSGLQLLQLYAAYNRGACRG